jgi:hypothetical protein
MAKKGSELKTNLATIKLGTRVRHTPDGAEGRIVWANATAVKIQWDDGEKVTWKRAALGVKGLEVLDPEEAPEPQEATAEAATEPAAEADANTAPQAAELPPEPTQPVDASEATAGPPAEQPTAPIGEPIPESAPVAPEADAQPAAKRQTRRTTPAEPMPARPSALDAAARVLAEEGRPMGCQELVGAMAVRGYWTSPGGKTPAATLYSALLREMQTKGEQARFVKVGKGQFALRQQA